MSQVVWTPKDSKANRMYQFMRFVEEKHALVFQDYQALHAWSVQELALFWEALCEFFAVSWIKDAQYTLSPYEHMMDAHWFKGATLNYAQQLLWRRDEHIALVSVDEAGHRQCFSYRELYEMVCRAAAGLKHLGVGVGDRVVAIMPNVAYTVIAFLATASIGAVWSSCSTDFGVEAAVDRLGQIQPKVLFICDGHWYYGKAHEDLTKASIVSSLIPSIQKVVVCPILNQGIELDVLPHAILWDNFLQQPLQQPFTALPFAQPLYILFSSGTTGKPKCIIHSAGGIFLQHLKELALHTDIHSTDNLFFYTTCGWMMWNWMVSVLALGATLTLYEGSPTYPDAGRLFQFIEDEKISVFGTSASFISTVAKTEIEPKNQFSLPTLRCILSTGSPLLPKHYDYIYTCVKADVQLSSISGGTDIVSCFALGNPMLPVYRGEIQCLGLGMAVEVFSETGQKVNGARGELVCTKPFPAMPLGFWNDPDKIAYKKAYFERFAKVWAHGDFAQTTEHHGLIIYGRSDAVLKPGGVRIGTAEIYRQVELVAEVLDSVVIGQEWQDGVRIVLFVKLRQGLTLDENLENSIRHIIRTHASPRHVPAKILQVPDIPRTISGKTVEIAVREVVHGHSVQNIQSLANPDSLNYFKNRAELLS